MASCVIDCGLCGEVGFDGYCAFGNFVSLACFGNVGFPLVDACGVERGNSVGNIDEMVCAVSSSAECDLFIRFEKIICKRPCGGGIVGQGFFEFQGVACDDFRRLCCGDVCHLT